MHHETRSALWNSSAAWERLPVAAGASAAATAAGDRAVLALRGIVDPCAAQASAANDAFYVNRWTDLEDYAKGLEQTARFLAKAEEVPANKKDILNEMSSDLAKNAVKLRAAATAHNVKDTTDALQQINLKVRQMRLTD